MTGADLDQESVRIDKNGNFWLGEECGPFLINIDASGKVLLQEVPMPHAMLPDNPDRNNRPTNLPSAGGFECMAINSAGDTPYPMLESTA